MDAVAPLVSKLKIISWNVNSLRAREPLVQKLIQKEKPDLLCIQELKIDDQNYVLNFFDPYHYATISQNQKSYNGVSISYQKELLIKDLTISELNTLQARNNVLLLEKEGIAIVNNYFPNGNPIDTEKFSYKLEWMDLLYNQLKQLKKNYEVIVTGDFNVIPADDDAHDIKKYRKDALAQPETRKEFYKLLNLDLLDVFENEPKKIVILFLIIKLINLEKKKV